MDACEITPSSTFVSKKNRKNIPIDIPDGWKMRDPVIYDGEHLGVVYGAIISGITRVDCFIIRRPRGWNKVIEVSRCEHHVPDKK